MCASVNSFGVKSPGKLILSGEHSVVHGAPALAMATDPHIQTHFKASAKQLLTLKYNNFNGEFSGTKDDYIHYYRQGLKRFEEFQQGHRSIQQVLEDPKDLGICTIGYVFDTFDSQVKGPWHMTIESELPMGCGMGSSGALIVNLLHQMNHHYELQLTEEDWYSHCQHLESLQHGQSSGIDLFVSLQGGCHFFQGGKSERRDCPDVPFFRVNTGKPDSDTGECVQHTSKIFKGSNLCNDFSAVTSAMDDAIKLNSLSEIQRCIRENHRLLTSIGVVPQLIQDFIGYLETQCVFAKISGAGAIRGDRSGMILIAGEQSPQGLIERYSLNCYSVKGDNYGVHAT